MGQFMPAPYRPRQIRARYKGDVKMIKVTFRTPEGVYWAICEELNYVRGSGYFMEKVVEDSDSHSSWQWAKTPENWKIMRMENT